MWSNSLDHCGCHFHCSGRCRTSRLALRAMRTGTVTNLRRIVVVAALASPVPTMAPAVRVRLNAMTAHTSHAAFAVNFPDGRCARALAFQSALTCSMTACWRWVLSAVTVSRSLVVNTAWNRCRSNNPG